MYPYDFKSKQNGINFREVFVVMPFDQKFDDLFNKVIKPATQKSNEILGFSGHQTLNAYRTKDDIRTTAGWLNVLEHLTTAQIVLGVLTDNNPNVFYELGIAHATQQISRQILIAEEGYDPTFDTKDLIFYEYKKNLLSNIEPLAKRISNAVQNYKIEEEKRIKQAKMLLGLHEFDVIMTQHMARNFAMHPSQQGADDYEKELIARHKVDHLKGSYDRHVPAIANLCSHGILGLNSNSEVKDGKTVVNYSFHWTDLGNCLLHSMKLISLDELKARREQLPPYFQ